MPVSPRRLAALAMFAAATATSGCSMLPPTYTPVPDITAAQATLNSGIKPYSQYVAGLKYDRRVPATAATELPRLLDSADRAVAQWISASATWELPQKPTNGVPDRDAVAVYNDAIGDWMDAQRDLVEVLVPCAGTTRMNDCLLASPDVYADWEQSALDVTEAENAMVKPANESRTPTP